MFKKDKPKEISISTKSKTEALIGVLLVLAAVVVYVFFVNNVSNDLSVAKADLTSKESQLASLETQNDAYRKAEADLDLTDVKRRDILKAVPIGLNQDEVIRNLVEIADTHDVELNSLSFSKGSSGAEGVGTLRISSSFEGNYSDLIDFLEGLEENARTMQISSVSVQVNTLDVSDVKRATFSLSMDTFYQE